MYIEEGRWSWEAFRKFDAKHPRIYQEFCYFALAAAARRPYFSARAIFQRIRWQTMIDQGGDFKLDNGWCSHYARKFMEDYPEHAGFFRLRKSRYHPDGEDGPIYDEV